MTTLTVTHVEETKPIKQVDVTNAKGYFDLVLNLNNNGKAIRIADKFGDTRVHVTLDAVDNLIEALKLVKARGTKQSVSSISYAA